MKREQNILQNRIVLYGNSDSGRFPRTFQIHRALKPGASAICYNASYKGSSEGILKEIYPEREGFDFIRNESGQLFLNSDEKEKTEKFAQYKRMYLKPYEQLSEKINEDFGYRFLKFITAVKRRTKRKRYIYGHLTRP